MALARDFIELQSTTLSAWPPLAQQAAEAVQDTAVTVDHAALSGDRDAIVLNFYQGSEEADVEKLRDDTIAKLEEQRAAIQREIDGLTMHNSEGQYNEAIADLGSQLRSVDGMIASAQLARSVADVMHAAAEAQTVAGTAGAAIGSAKETAVLQGGVLMGEITMEAIERMSASQVNALSSQQIFDMTPEQRTAFRERIIEHSVESANESFSDISAMEDELLSQGNERAAEALRRTREQYEEQLRLAREMGDASKAAEADYIAARIAGDDERAADARQRYIQAARADAADAGKSPAEMDEIGQSAGRLLDSQGDDVVNDLIEQGVPLEEARAAVTRQEERLAALSEARLERNEVGSGITVAAGQTSEAVAAEHTASLLSSGNLDLAASILPPTPSNPLTAGSTGHHAALEAANIIQSALNSIQTDEGQETTAVEKEEHSEIVLADADPDEIERPHVGNQQPANGASVTV